MTVAATPLDPRPEIPFDAALRARLAANLGAHPRHQEAPGDRKHAAVAVIVLDSDAERHGDDPTALDRLGDFGELPGVSEDFTGLVSGTAGGAAVLLTRRCASLRAHTSQWAFPGGRLDAGETPFEAAVREVEEEVGLELGAAQLLGMLDDYPSRSGYLITPFVFWADAGMEPVANPDEVASLHRISLRELAREDAPRYVHIPQSDRPIIQMPVGGDLIHAPTGAILHQFQAVACAGQCVRVADSEEPVFAWK